MGKITAQDVLLLEEYQRDIADLKEKEVELRKKIVNHFRYGGKLEGVQTKTLEGLDADIKITLRLNRKVDEDAIDTLWSDLNDEQRACIKYVPEVRVGPFKKLVKDNAAGKLLNCIVETPGLAGVKLKYDD